jgi:hypothetical protein
MHESKPIVPHRAHDRRPDCICPHAVVSLILGVPAIPMVFMGGLPGFLLGGFAFAVGDTALRKIRADRYRAGKKLAVAGMILGAVASIAFALMFVIVSW